MEQLLRQQRALAELGLEAARATNASELLQRASELVARAQPVELCKVLQLLPDCSQFLLVAGVGWSDGLVGTARLDADTQSQASFTMRAHTTVLVHDVSAEQRFRTSSLLREHGACCGMGVAIRVAGTVWGVLGAFARGIRQFSPDDAAFLQSVAEILAATLDRLAVHKALLDSERHMRAAQRISNIGSWEYDPEKQQITCSDQASALLGKCPEAFDGCVDRLLALVLPQDRERVAAALLAAADQPLDFEFRIRRSDGTERWLILRGCVELGGPNGSERRIGVIMDVTAHQHRLRLDAWQAQVLDAVLTADALPAVLETVVRGLSGIVTGARAAIILLDPAQQTLRVGAAHGLASDFTAAIDGMQIGGSACPCGMAAFRKEQVIVENIAISALSTKWRNLALEQGLRACWSSPVIDSHGKVIALLVLYPDQVGRPDAQDLDLMDRAVRAIGIALLRWQGMQALRASEEQFRRVFDDAATGIAVTSLDCRFLDANAAYCALLGYTLVELRQLHAEDLTLAEDVPEMRRLTHELLNGTRGSYVVERRNRTKSGSFVWLRRSVSVKRDPHGMPVGLIGIVQDISQQKSAEQQVMESEERFRLLAQTTQDVIWDWNLVSNRVWWSDSLQTLFGYSPDTASQDDGRDWATRSVSATWLARLHPDDRVQAQASLVAVMEGEKDLWQQGYRYQRADGTYVAVVDRGFVVRDAQGHPLRMIGGLRDVTEQRSLEDQLRQSQRLEAVGQLTGGMAHDFNNLLTVIMGNAEVLVDALSGDADLQGLARMIDDASKRGAELTQSMLAFARRQPLEPRVVDINSMIAGMDGMMRRTLGEHFAITFAREPSLWQALVDPAQLESALLNLCLNARDAMPGGGKLTVETSNRVFDQDYADRYVDLAAGAYVMVAVSDTGVGIAPEHLERVVEPFFTTKEAGKGTGLGLSMVYGFVKQSSGHLSIYSELGRGTTVKMYLPRVQDASLQVSASEEVPAPAGGGTGTILLVEDDELVRRFAAGQLGSLGYRVIEASDGPQALAIAEQDTAQVIDLLFTDVVMPGGMNGPALAEAVRGLRPELPVLFTSGYTENAILHQGQLDAAVQLLGKPYRRAELALRVREALGARQAMAGVDANLVCRVAGDAA